MNEQNYESNNTNVSKKKSGLATAGLVLGIIGLCISFIPIMYYISFVLGALALIFGAIALAKKRSVGKSVAALVLGIIAVIFSIAMINAVDEAVDELDASFSELDEELAYMDGSKTDDILDKYLEVELGTFNVIENEYFDETELSVTVKNKAEGKKSYSIEIEAVDANGNRLDTDYVYANDLASGQSQTFKIFTLVTSENIEAMKGATFRIIEVSMY